MLTTPLSIRPSARLQPLSLALILALSAPAFAVVPSPSFTNVHTTPNQSVGANVSQTFSLAHTTANAAGSSAQAQVETLTATGSVTAGDQFSVSLPGPHVASYTAQSGDTPTQVAAGLNTAIQASTGYAAQAFTTGASGGVVTFTAKVAGTGFTLTSPTYTAAAGGGSATYSSTPATPASAATPQVETLTVGGGVVNGDVFSVTLPGSVAVTYTASGDTANTAATGLYNAILASAGYAAQTFTASVNNNVVTLTEKASDNGAGFTLAGIGATNTSTLTDNVSTTAVLGVAQVTNVSIGGSVSVGDDFSVTLPVGSVVVHYTAVSGATPTSVASTLNGLIQADGSYGTQPFTTSASSGTITFTEKASDAGAGFTLSGVTYTPIAAGGSALNDQITTANNTGTSAQAQVDTLTVGGSVDTGDVYSIVLPGPVTATYTAVASDTPTLVATGLNTAIQASAGYGSQPFTTAAASGAITFTAATPGTGWTLGAASSTNAAAVAQVDTLTPAGVVIGENYAATVGSSVYAFVATDTLPATVVTALKTAINGDGAATVTASGSTTLILTAKSAGTAFTASGAVAGAANAGNSTLAVGSSSLTVGGATTTATLTLKDASSATLFNVNGSGATITSSSANCTVGSLSRSTTNGTVTATVTAASAGSCTIGATLDGTTALTATQAVTVAAAASTPQTTTSTTPVTISSGTGTISGTGTLTGMATVTISSGSTVNVSSSSASGSTLILPSGNTPVTLNLGGSSPINVISGGTSGTSLGVTSVTLSGNSTPVNTITLNSGSATLSSSGSGALLAVGSGSNTLVLTSGSGGAVIGATVSGASASGGSTTIKVSSGTVSAPRNCGTKPTLPVAPTANSSESAWLKYRSDIESYENAALDYNLCLAASLDSVVGQRATVRASTATPAALTLYQGESIVYDSNGSMVGTSLVDGGAGGPQAKVFASVPSGMALASVPISVDGTPTRLNGADLGSALVSAMATQLGSTLTRASNSSIGGIVTALADGTTITSTPIGHLQIAPGATSIMQSNGQLRMVVNGVVVTLAPSLANPDGLAGQFKSLDAQASEMVLTNGLLKVMLGGAQFIVQPAWTASPGSASGLSTDAAGNLQFGDGKLQQKLYPAFANLNMVIAMLSGISGASAPVQAADGTVSVTLGGSTFTLRPGYQLTSTPAAHATDLWWVDSGTFYLNYMDGSAQAFSVR